MLYIINNPEISPQTKVEGIVLEGGVVQLKFGTIEPPKDAFEVAVTLDGVTLVLLGENPDPKVEEIFSTIATKCDLFKVENWHRVTEEDHYKGLVRLSELPVNVWVRQSCIGKLNAHRLIQENKAIRLE